LGGWKYSVIDGKALHKEGDSVNAYETIIDKDKALCKFYYYGKRVTQPHKAYSRIENSVKEYLNHMDKNSRLHVSHDEKKIRVFVFLYEF